MSTAPATRAQKVRYASALLERARRFGGPGAGAAGSASGEGEAKGQSERRPRLNLLEWTTLHRAYLVPDRPFDLRHHPFLISLYSDEHPHVVVYKAAQMGASEWMISDAFHSCDVKGATVLYVFPTDVHVSDFSTARIGPAIEASPYLESIISSEAGPDGESGAGTPAGGRQRRRRGSDRVTLKRIRNRFIYLRGGQVKVDGRAPQLKSIDADALYLDEVDEIDPRAISLARQRLGHSKLKLKRDASTPTYANIGVHALWQETDQREWFIRCGRCGRWQFLTIKHVVQEWDLLERPVAWHGAPDKAWAACERCGGRLDHRAAGQWVARYPGREIHGYHLTKLFSPMARLLDIVRALQETDESKRKETVNQDLGEPYSPRGGRLTDEQLDACRREYGHGPAPGEKTYAGIDVGKLINVVIRGSRHPETGEIPQRWAGEVEHEADVVRELRRWNVTRCVMDALPETRMARNVQAAMPPGVVWLAYYTDGGNVAKKPEPISWDEEDGTVTMDRTRTLDDMVADFVDKTRTLPAYARDVPDYYAHMKASVRVMEKTARGDKVARYIHTEPDHYAHAENYARAAEQAPRYVPAASEAVSREQMRSMLS